MSAETNTLDLFHAYCLWLSMWKCGNKIHHINFKSIAGGRKISNVNALTTCELYKTHHGPRHFKEDLIHAMHTPSTSGISAQRLSNGLQVNHSRKRAAASQGHGYYVLTTTQLTPTWYCCIDHCVHHSNTYMCMFTMATYIYVCTFHVTMATYMYVSNFCHHGNILCSPQQYIHVHVHHGNIHVCMHFPCHHGNIHVATFMCTLAT